LKAELAGRPRQEKTSRIKKIRFRSKFEDHVPHWLPTGYRTGAIW